MVDKEKDMSNFGWNNTIQKMGKLNSIKSLLHKLYPLWQNGKVTVLLYSALNTVGFADFNGIDNIDGYIDNIVVDMIYIRTANGEADIYLHEYETYRFNKDNSLTIVCTNKEHKILF